MTMEKCAQKFMNILIKGLFSCYIWCPDHASVMHLNVTPQNIVNLDISVVTQSE